MPDYVHFGGLGAVASRAAFFSRADVMSASTISAWEMPHPCHKEG